MKQKLLTIKSLLVAAGLLLGGANSVWADGTKRTLDSNDYTGGTTDWTSNGAAAYKDGGTAPRKYYAQCYENSSKGNRSCYKSVTYDYTAGTGYTTSAVSTLGYNIEFDFLMRSGACDDRSQSEFVIPTTGPNIVSNTYYSGTDYIFALSQPTRANGNTEDYGKDIGYDETWYVNDLANSTGSTVTLTNDKWYHIKLVVTSSSVNYTISEYTADGSSEMTTITNGTGSKTVASMPTIKGFWALLGRNVGSKNGLLNFTNFDMYDYTDAETVTAPTIGTPVYAGANRTVTITGGTSSKSNAVTTYYTTDGSDPTSSSSVYSSALTIDEDCTVKAISISSTDVSSNIASQAVTVGKLTLNAPTFTKTAYSDGSYTYTISDDQSALEYEPASTTIKYRVGTTGDYATYTSGVAVPVGSILYAYAEADNYTTSSTSAISAAALPAMTLDFGQNFAGVVDADMTMAVSEGPTVTNSVSGGETNYFIPSSNGTDALTNENISFYFGYNSDNTQNKWWTLKTAGMYTPFGRGSANVRIGNLTAGQIVVVNASAINSVTGLTELSTYSYGTTHYYTATATTAYVNIARYQTVYSVNVYTLDNETVGALDCSTNYYNAWNTTPIWINAGETAYYKFKNYNNGGSLLYQNWYLFGATEASENVVIFGPNHSNTDTNATYTSKPTFTNADLNGATIELTATLADAGDDTYTLTVTGVTTKADGTTTLSPNLVYTQTNLAASKLKLYISPEKNWLELLEEAVAVTVSDAGYATYVPSNDLDFSATSIEAYKVKVSKKGVATLTKVDNVPAGTPVLLYKDGGTTEDIPVMTGAAAVTENDLVAGNSTTATEGVATTDGEYTNMILNNISGNVGFYFANGQKVAANRAYLHIPTSYAPDALAPMMMVFDGEATGIADVRGKMEDVRSDFFDLQGRKVAQPAKGLYIVNGKKVVIK